MKNLLLLTFSILCLNAYSYSDFAIHEENVANLTLGLNPVSHEPLSGSDWTIEQSTAFRGNCDEFVEHVYNDGDYVFTYEDYLDPSMNNCATASHPLDTDNVIAWSDNGLVQDAAFGTNTKICSKDILCDGVNQQILYSTESFGPSNPTPGVNGSNAGRVDVFAYKINSVTVDNSNGTGGLGGDADLAGNTPATRYCVELKDASTHGTSSTYAEVPNLKIKIVNWTPFTEGGDAPDGTAGTEGYKQINIHTHIDESMRYWIAEDTIFNP